MLDRGVETFDRECAIPPDHSIALPQRDGDAMRENLLLHSESSAVCGVITHVRISALAHQFTCDILCSQCGITWYSHFKVSHLEHRVFYLSPSRVSKVKEERDLGQLTQTYTNQPGPLRTYPHYGYLYAIVLISFP